MKLLLLQCIFTFLVTKGYAENVTVFHNGDNHKNVINVTKDAERRGTITGDANSDKILLTFREVVIRGVLIANYIKKGSLPFLLSHPFGAATVLIFTMIQVPDNKQSEWDKLEDKMTRKMNKRFDRYHLDNLDEHWNEINLRFFYVKQENRSFEINDLLEILKWTPSFFPQQRNGVTFTVRWPDTIMKFMSILNAVFVDLQIKDKVDTCAWGHELAYFRKAVLMAAKALARGRYRDLEKTSSYAGYWYYPATLSFSDPYLSLAYEKIKLDDVQRKVLNHLVEDTKDWLMQNLITRFNQLFNGAWTARGVNATCKLDVKRSGFLFRGNPLRSSQVHLNKTKLMVTSARTGATREIKMVDRHTVRSDDGNGNWEEEDVLFVWNHNLCESAAKRFCFHDVLEVSDDGKTFFVSLGSTRGIPDRVKNEGKDKDDDKVKKNKDDMKMKVKVMNGRTKKEGYAYIMSDDEGQYAKGEFSDVAEGQWRVNDILIIMDLKFCNRGCNPPMPITREELDISWPQDCMDSTGTCTLPCGSYDSPERFCIKFPDHYITTNRFRTYTTGYFSSGSHVYTSPCNYPNWEKCMPAKPVPQINWESRVANIKKKV